MNNVSENKEATGLAATVAAHLHNKFENIADSQPPREVLTESVTNEKGEFAKTFWCSPYTGYGFNILRRKVLFIMIVLYIVISYSQKTYNFKSIPHFFLIKHKLLL